MPSYIDGALRILTPGFEYLNFEKTGLQQRIELPIRKDFYQPGWSQIKGPKVRHNQWRFIDEDGDGALDLVTGIEDWSEYGWDDAFNSRGEWTNGPLHGFVLLHRNTGTTEDPKYLPPRKLEAGGKPIDTFGCPSPNFADFDNDGDLDLLCGEFLDGFTYFENVGSRTKPVYRDGQRVRLLDGEPLKMDLEMIVPIAFDWDKDGDLDLIVGDEDGRVAFIENLNRPDDRQLQSPRKLNFARPRYFQQEADTLKCGALATPCGVDWDGDGDIDIVSGNTAGYIEFFENLSGVGIAQPKWAAPTRLQAEGKLFRVMAGPNGSIQGPAEAKWGYTTLNGGQHPSYTISQVTDCSIWQFSTAKVISLCLNDSGKTGNCYSSHPSEFLPTPMKNRYASMNGRRERAGDARSRLSIGMVTGNWISCSIPQTPTSIADSANRMAYGVFNAKERSHLRISKATTSARQPLISTEMESPISSAEQKMAGFIS